MTTKTVYLFTREEHAIIADWLRVEPKCDDQNLPHPLDALETLGFVELGFGKNASRYGDHTAAVATMVLERIQDTLPQRASVQLRGNDGEGKVVTLARKIHALGVQRTIELMPHYLMTINWANRDPKYPWPCTYHVTWVPLYDVYVVTRSLANPKPYGYWDLAIGCFPLTDDFVAAAAEEIRIDWESQRDQFCQSRWIRLYGSGLIEKATALRLRDEVWSDGEDVQENRATP